MTNTLHMNGLVTLTGSPKYFLFASKHKRNGGDSGRYDVKSNHDISLQNVIICGRIHFALLH